MEQQQKEKGTEDSTQDSVKNQLQDTKTRAFPRHLKKSIAIDNIAHKTTFLIELYEYQFEIKIIKS